MASTLLVDYSVRVANIAGEHVLASPSLSHRVIAIFDGTGSWGAGAEFAAWCAAELGTFLAKFPEANFTALVQELQRIEHAAPPTLRDCEFGYACSMAMVVLDGRQVAIAAKGSLGLLITDGSKLEYSVRPPSTLESMLPSTSSDEIRDRLRRGDFRDLGNGSGLNLEALQRTSSGPWFGNDSEMTIHRAPFTGRESVVVADRSVLDSVAELPRIRAVNLDLGVLLELAEHPQRPSFLLLVGPKRM